MDVVKADNLEKTFGSVRAVHDLTLSVASGEIFGFLGTNGAGKTTTIKMLIGLISNDGGTLSIFGNRPDDAMTRRRIGYMPETAYYYPYLTVRELLRFYGSLCGMTHSEIDKRSDLLIKRVDLEAASNRPLKTYSKGMLQRAGIAQALLHDPDLLILDEPFTGLDPLARIHFRDLILELKSKGKTIFLSSHELSEAELMCDRVAILRDGRCVVQGSVSEIAGDGDGNLERIFLNVLKRDSVKNGGVS